MPLTAEERDDLLIRLDERQKKSVEYHRALAERLYGNGKDGDIPVILKKIDTLNGDIIKEAKERALNTSWRGYSKGIAAGLAALLGGILVKLFLGTAWGKVPIFSSNLEQSRFNRTDFLVISV